MIKASARVAYRLAIAISLLSVVSCGGRMPESLGVQAGGLAPCPASPNCVSSFATDAQHAIVALRIEGNPRVAWEALGAELRGRERAAIVTETASYLHAVFTTALMRYRDDVEFLLLAGEGVIEVRSASRVGYGDMDANRERIESLRAALAQRGVVMAAAGD